MKSNLQSTLIAKFTGCSLFENCTLVSQDLYPVYEQSVNGSEKTHWGYLCKASSRVRGC